MVFPCHALECSAIHLAASCSVMKPLITSVSPSGHRISTPQPDPGFFRAQKVGRCSDITRICAYGGPVQASYPATIDDEIAMTRSNRRPFRLVSTTPPMKMMVRRRCSDGCAALGVWEVCRSSARHPLFHRAPKATFRRWLGQSVQAMRVPRVKLVPERQ